jgi:hypothetical protein
MYSPKKDASSTMGVQLSARQQKGFAEGLVQSGVGALGGNKFAFFFFFGGEGGRRLQSGPRAVVV